MQTEKQQRPWRFKIYARYKTFNFRFKVTRTLPFPSWKFHRISILLRLHKFLLQVQSESPKQERPSFNSTVLRSFEKFRIRRHKKCSLASKETLDLQHPEANPSINQSKFLAYEEPVCLSFLVVGIIAFISGYIPEKFLCSVILLCLAMLLKKYTTGRSTTTLAFSLVATVVFSMVFHLNGFMNYDQVHVHGYIPESALKAWNFICGFF